MHKSPSLFFDILTEEDESKRDEKIKRASFDIKSNLTSSPKAASPGQIASANGIQQEHVQHTAQQAYHDSSLYHTTAQPFSQPTEQYSAGTPAQQHPNRVTFAPSPDNSHELPQLQQSVQVEHSSQQLVLSPQEVLQELLGDLFIPQDRLIMGDLLGQGGFADVHAAQLVDPLLPDFSESVAVKRLRPDVLKGPADLKEFLTEANLLRKLAHRNIVALRGVGASDLSDLVNMRESMFVVQEFMAGGDLKQLVMSAMSRPFDPPYSKTQALTWAMHIAEALHYLHCVCRPMIIHRDLKLDNILLSSTDLDKSVAKLADFGLHKRVRRLVSSGALVAWDQETTYHGADFERSYYGGNIYLSNKSAMSAAGSIVDETSVHGSVGGSMRGAADYSNTVGTITAAAAEPAGAEAGFNNTNGLISSVLQLNGAENSSVSTLAAGGISSQKPPLCPAGRSISSGAAGPQASAVNSYSSRTCGPEVSKCSDSAASIQSAAAAAPAGADATAAAQDPGSPGFQQQQQHLMNVVRAKSKGLLGKQDFVAQVLSAASRPELLQDHSELGQQSKDVSRTFAAVVALEGSVRAGSAYYQQQQQQLSAAGADAPSGLAPSTNSSRFRGSKRQQQTQLCPQLVADLKTGLAHAKDTQAFIEATQKVGSLMYMAPEVLTGHQYNEKIDVFSFGVILYELLSGIIIAGRVAMAGQHDELLDYARQVANGHREMIPPNWPPQVKGLISACWAQDPAKRPGFKKILKQLYAMKQEGVDVQMEHCRPKGDYNPVSDCGCTIM